MLEREMEDLIAANPDYFFPRHGFTLQGRQQSFKGVGRFDLLFTDRHGMNILMELKAVPARYDVIDQIGRYRDALIALGANNVIMWIVAPSIPAGMREFLAHLGIEHTEIHESEFNRAAELAGYQLREQSGRRSDNEPTSDNKRTGDATSVAGSSATSVMQNRTDGKLTDAWGFGRGTQPSFLIHALEEGGKTKEQIRSEYIAHFHPDLSYAEAKKISGFNVFFSDSKRPFGTYHASRSLVINSDNDHRLSLDLERCTLIKEAVANGILQKLRGLHFQRDKDRFNSVLAEYGIPQEL